MEYILNLFFLQSGVEGLHAKDDDDDELSGTTAEDFLEEQAYEEAGVLEKREDEDGIPVTDPLPQHEDGTTK